MARSIINPRLIRGQLLFQVADVLFPTFAEAACAWAAATEALTELRRQGGAS
jgi:hypothetical protein